MTERISVARRRALLVDRQMSGADDRADRDVADVAQRLGLLHSTDPSTPYLSIHARSDATIDEVDRALYEQRSLMRVTTLRRTVFAMPLDVAALATSAYNPAMAAKLRKQLEIWLAEYSDDVDAADRDGARTFLAPVEQRVIEHLRTDGPATGNEIAAAVPELQVRVDPMPGKAYSKSIRITSKVLEILAAEGSIVRGRPKGDLTSGAWTWAAASDWLADAVPRLDPVDALAGLMRRYLAAFGPATVTDATWWTGLTKTKIRSAFATIDSVEVELEDSPEPGWVLPHDDLQVEQRSKPVVALLPGLDSTAMGWKQRSWYVDDTPSTGLFDRNGNAGPTIWVDGNVIGAWTQRSTGEVVTEISDERGSEIRAAVATEAERLDAWLGDVRVNWRYPTPITKRLQP